MKKYVKEFFHRGLIFAGFGPVIMGIIYLILSHTLNDFSLSGSDACLAIVSTYLLAFVHAGASVFNQIEEWPLAKSLLCHFASLYATYVLCYLINAWIPFEWFMIVIFTAVFAVVYFIVWTIVFISVKSASKRFNRKLR